MRRVVLVCGPPASGKSTWVAKQASDGDTVIDFDRLCRELGSTAHHDHAREVADRAHVLRSALERQVSAMESGTAWVIRSAPDPQQRRSLARSLRATETVVIAASAEQARARAAADNRPDWTGRAIDRWWSLYRPDSSRLERELSLSEPLEGYPIMPDDTADTEQTTAQDDSTGDDTATEEQEQETSEVTDTGADDTEDDKPQAGGAFDEKAAKAELRKKNSEAANLRKRLRELERKNQELEPLAKRAREAAEADQTEAQRLQARLTEREQEIHRIRQRAVKSEVRAMAADGFADKTDPEALLDLDAYIGDDGEIATDRIKADLEDLLDRKPHLAKPKPDTPQRRKPAPDRTQASGANQPRAKDPASEFAGFVNSRLLKGRR
ncbi:AAA family ATPase [Actinomadura decatromicini]|uniref:AAA family ATPase n=1 Tax=Actinomadura decatromicini TaxID=2604572 RepID=UPI001653343A|nr:AAA family ATPase [Actinomadura decatromicini]